MSELDRLLEDQDFTPEEEAKVAFFVGKLCRDKALQHDVTMFLAAVRCATVRLRPLEEYRRKIARLAAELLLDLALGEWAKNGPVSRPR